jgi:hypothetical protein
MDFKLVNQLQKLNEDNNLFKPASEEDLNNRPVELEWDIKSLEIACPQEVDLLREFGLNPDISPMDTHLVGFVNENDIATMEDLPKLLNSILRAAQIIDKTVKGNRPQ